MMPIADTTSERALKAMKQLHETCSEHFDDVFRTISADNGFELSDLSNLERRQIPWSRLLILTHLAIKNRKMAQWPDQEVVKRIDDFTGR